MPQTNFCQKKRKEKRNKHSQAEEKRRQRSRVFFFVVQRPKVYIKYCKGPEEEIHTHRHSHNYSHTLSEWARERSLDHELLQTCIKILCCEFLNREPGLRMNYLWRPFAPCQRLHWMKWYLWSPMGRGAVKETGEEASCSNGRKPATDWGMQHEKMLINVHGR